MSHVREVVERGRTLHAEWQPRYDAWAAANPERKALHERMSTRTLPDGWADALPTFPTEKDGKPNSIATRPEWTK